MSKATCLMIAAGLLLTGCNTDKSGDSADGSEVVGPAVQEASTYTVLEDEDIIYAEGLGYYPDTEKVTALPLKLDVYYPDNSAVSRPVFMWIHGGGFTGGSKTADDIEEMAAFYASRGWVFVSINYRTTEVLGDGYELDEVVAYYQGIAPQEWTVFADKSTESDLNFHQSIAMYTAQRDAKAALRWIVANASTYDIDTDYVTVGGNSAGAITAITLGVTEPEDFRDEIPTTDDPTLSTTHPDETYAVKSLVWFWGSTQKLELFKSIYGLDRHDSNDPELFMAHGDLETEENSFTPHTEAIELQDLYDSFGIYSELFLLEGWHHGAWEAEVDGQTLSELSFDFIVKRQNLQVE